MNYGLNAETIQKILAVLAVFPQVEEAVLYGSRAKGTYKNGSDIDLTLKGEHINLSTLNKISLQLDDLYLPYTFDLSAYAHIDNPDLIDHIQRVVVTFYKKKEEV